MPSSGTTRSAAIRSRFEACRSISAVVSRILESRTCSDRSRRELLHRGAWAAAGGWVTLAMPTLGRVAIPPIGRTRPSHLKLSIAAYSYRDYLTGKTSPRWTSSTSSTWPPTWASTASSPRRTTSRPTSRPTTCNRLKLHAFTLGLDISGHGGRQQLLPATRLQARRSKFRKTSALDRPRGRARRPGDPDLCRQRAQRRNRGPGGRAGPSRESKPSCRTPPRRGSCWPSRITAASRPHPSRFSSWSRPSIHPISA